jgi:crotonobetainyl-CoA:carnitine CoA-transferase CaiB-like acyl-CoA transferase
MSQALADPQVLHRQLQRGLVHAALGEAPTIACPIRYGDESMTSDRAPPSVGQHTRDVLRSWLMKTQAQADELLETGVAAQA